MEPGSSFSFPLAGVEVRPGETTTIAIGRTRYSVELQVRWPEGMPRKENWRVTAVIEPVFTELASAPAVPARPAFAGLELRIFREKSRNRFVAEGVDTGNYRVTVRVTDPAAQTNPPPAATTIKRSPLPQMSRPLAQAELFLSVPADPAIGTLDLGEVELKPNP